MIAKKLRAIKALVKSECTTLGFAPEWFYVLHLLRVEKYAKELLERLPKANKEIVLLGVWLHDLQRVRGKKGGHEKVGAKEAEKVLKQFHYSEEVIKKVKQIIITHTCESSKPKTLEGKILATADAMSHYSNEFYLALAALRDWNAKEFKKFALEKLDRDYNKKILFGFAKQRIKKQHSILKAFFEMG